MSTNNSKKLSFTENALICAAVGCASKTLSSPIETMKLIITNSHEFIKKGVLSDKRTGFFNGIGKILRSRHRTLLWQGNLRNIARSVPSLSLVFALNAEIKDFLPVNKSDSATKTSLLSILAGGMAGLLALSVFYPLDLGRSSIAMDSMKYRSTGKKEFDGIIDYFKKTVSLKGVKGLYSGGFNTCTYIFIYRGLYFGLYDTGKSILKVENVFACFVLGYFTCLSASLASYPVDTARRRMMLNCNTTGYSGYLDCFTRIIREEGTRSLTIGSGAHIFRSFFTGFTISAFDCCTRHYSNAYKQKY